MKIRGLAVLLPLAACGPDDTTAPVGNSAPFVVLVTPADGALFDIGVPIPVTGSVADADEADLSVLTLLWGGVAVGAGGPEHPTPEGAISFQLVGIEAGTHPLSVTVSDSDGAAASVTLGFAVGTDDDGDGYPIPEDCDDTSVAVHPDAIELCNGIDDNCANGIDDGLEVFTWHPDDDNDGYGDPTKSLTTCEDFSATRVLDDTDCNDNNLLLNQDDDDQDGSSTCAGDCDDADPLVSPSAPEVCNGMDDNCAAGIDEGFPTNTWFLDGDLDGYGDPSSEVVTCQDFSGTHIPVGTDCNDADPALNHDDADLDGADTCGGDCDDLAASLNLDDVDGDGLDTCEGDCDDLDALATFETNWLVDGDADGYGAGATITFGCSPVEGLVPELVGVDCDDVDPDVHPGASDICEDGFDANCDDIDPSCGPIGTFQVNDGPSWLADPPVYSCIEACALLFGGVDTDYHCSVDPVVLDYTSYLSGWGDTTYCSNPQPEDFSKIDAGHPGYNCGVAFCAYSAYVADNCQIGAENYCWLR